MQKVDKSEGSVRRKATDVGKVKRENEEENAACRRRLVINKKENQRSESGSHAGTQLH